MGSWRSGASRRSGIQDLQEMKRAREHRNSGHEARVTAGPLHSDQTSSIPRTTLHKSRSLEV